MKWLANGCIQLCLPQPDSMTEFRLRTNIYSQYTKQDSSCQKDCFNNDADAHNGLSTPGHGVEVMVSGLEL